MIAGWCRVSVQGVVAVLIQLTVNHALAGMRVASDLQRNSSYVANCHNELCHDLYELNVTGFLLGAPCPPPQNFSLLCEYGTSEVLSCEEKTVIIRKCLQIFPEIPTCDILEQCQHLGCLTSSFSLSGCGRLVSNSPTEVVVVLNTSRNSFSRDHSMMTEGTESTVRYYENGTGTGDSHLPPPPKALREDSDNLVGLAALLLLLIPLVFIIWFCCKKKKAQKENKYPKQEDASSTAGLCKTVAPLNESAPPGQTDDFENLDLPYIDSDELETVRTESPPNSENTEVTMT